MYILTCDRCGRIIKETPHIGVFESVRRFTIDADGTPVNLCSSCYNEWTKLYKDMFKNFVGDVNCDGVHDTDVISGADTETA